MLSPKFSLSHFFFKPNESRYKALNVVDLFLDYNCPYSAKIYYKFLKVIPKLNQKHPGKFQFVFINVVQPWHPNSVLLHEFSLVVAESLRKNDPETSNEKFWATSKVLFDNIERFYDSATVSLGRNEIYKLISDVVQKDLDFPLDKEGILGALSIKEADVPDASNSGNDAITDMKYFARYMRTIGVHVTPSVSVNGIVNTSVSSQLSEEELVEVFESYL
ncbi:hypothetical protein METBIDRAFT_38236 [Metschnikowia bicuspidata var. bicuspidata NRRL YB-4993]|uniref:Thioredoxin-like fold domain-containing protein n=1 Tax=Metschnikowia bicuspidata var. bicuspidata NRRL YB-4993 TaxID=869754 RepID=A0A1A0HK53_9ASCO|nr:hypothetical protein METBIDRAFT_38236 [Metschnikowia bicuspidata var. bicuspidata NRRL YB-4993]OBA24267.1 hypothetical protein METBIDRAFT_38236 [Metschnikowia bicuspidata var. bicuspidata NRRL YB-4993]